MFNSKHHNLQTKIASVAAYFMQETYPIWEILNYLVHDHVLGSVSNNMTLNLIQSAEKTNIVTCYMRMSILWKYMYNIGIWIAISVSVSGIIAMACKCQGNVDELNKEYHDKFTV